MDKDKIYIFPSNSKCRTFLTMAFNKALGMGRICFKNEVACKRRIFDIILVFYDVTERTINQKQYKLHIKNNEWCNFWYLMGW